MKRVLITGGAGFIGSTLARRLAADAQVERITIVDDLSSGSEENFAGIESRVDLVLGDIREAERIGDAFEGVDTVFHLAAIASVTRSIREPEFCYAVNVQGTVNVLRLASEHGVRRIVFASSSAVYGGGPELPKREDMTAAPESGYAEHKLAGEHLLHDYREKRRLETVALRFFNVFGPRQAPHSEYAGVVSLFSKAILERRRPTIYGDGEQSRDFIFADDIAALCDLAARSQAGVGKVYNGGRGGRVTLNQIWALLQKIEGIDLPAEHGPWREGDVRHSQADISAARRDLGFEPKVSLEDGLRRTLEWTRGVRGS